jgi:hypothetical protein
MDVMNNRRKTFLHCELTKAASYPSIEKQNTKVEKL